MMKLIRPSIIAIATLIAVSATAFAGSRPGGWHTRKIRQPQIADTSAYDAVITTCEPAPVRPAVDSAADSVTQKPRPAETPADETTLSISGKARVTDPEMIAAFVRKVNKDFPLEIAEAYLRVGDRYGIRGDVALCQAIIETGWFRFADGTAVTIDQHNYCGMGVASRGMKGCIFETVEDGATAHIQHLFAYATRAPLPDGEKLLDPRFRLVTRGIAPNWEDLSNRWAMNPNYGNQILTLYNRLLNFTNEK